MSHWEGRFARHIRRAGKVILRISPRSTARRILTRKGAKGIFERLYLRERNPRIKKLLEPWISGFMADMDYGGAAKVQEYEQGMA